MVRVVVVGDVHATSAEIDDCTNLIDLVVETKDKYSCDAALFLGDLYHNHDVLSVRVVEFWKSNFKKLSSNSIYCIVGNHDQVNTTQQYPHALISHDEYTIVDRPQHMFLAEVVGMPYYPDREKFVKDAVSLKEQYPRAHTLICHQSFQGARFENGFFDPHGVDLALIPFDNVISGHIHTTSMVGKCRYPGSPRWRTESDANADKNIYVYEFDSTGYKVVAEIPTGSACKRIWSYQDLPEAPVDEFLGKCGVGDDIRVDVYGDTIAAVSARCAQITEKYGARTRPFSATRKEVDIPESMGIDAAFAKFAQGFDFPNGTDANWVLVAVNRRWK